MSSYDAFSKKISSELPILDSALTFKKRLSDHKEDYTVLNNDQFVYDKELQEEKNNLETLMRHKVIESYRSVQTILRELQDSRQDPFSYEDQKNFCTLDYKGKKISLTAYYGKSLEDIYGQRSQDHLVRIADEDIKIDRRALADDKNNYHSMKLTCYLDSDNPSIDVKLRKKNLPETFEQAEESRPTTLSNILCSISLFGGGYLGFQSAISLFPDSIAASIVGGFTGAIMAPLAYFALSDLSNVKFKFPLENIGDQNLTLDSQYEILKNINLLPELLDKGITQNKQEKEQHLKNILKDQNELKEHRKRLSSLGLNS